MPLILNIETSTKACSVALGKDGNLIAVKESVDEKYAHSEKLTTYIQHVFSESNCNLNELDAVAVSKGPGSYTGLRIGVSTAKGLCFALNKPLIAIHTLMAMAKSEITSHYLTPARTDTCGKRRKEGEDSNFPNFFCPLLDARRMEVYCAVFDENLNEIYPTSAEIVDENFIRKIFNCSTTPSNMAVTDSQIYFFGDGLEKCKTKIIHPNAKFIAHVYPSAKSMIELSEEKFQNKRFENLACFEPFYLKDFVWK